MQPRIRQRRRGDPWGRSGTPPGAQGNARRSMRRIGVSRLPRLLVGRMLCAVPAEFFVLDTSGLLLLVLRRRVIAPLAVGAFQRYDVSHGVALQVSDVCSLFC